METTIIIDSKKLETNMYLHYTPITETLSVIKKKFDDYGYINKLCHSNSSACFRIRAAADMTMGQAGGQWSLKWTLDG